jgi:hypothetical protein
LAVKVSHPLDGVATAIFEQAIRAGRCGELLECLFDGGSATIDTSGELVLASADALQQFVRRDDD